jgi:hypothetical protein
VKLRNLGLIVGLLIALSPAPARAQGDFVKGKLKDLIETSGIYVSLSSRSALDDNVDMGRSIGIGWGMAGRNPRDGKKYPFSFSSYSGNLETDSDGARFGRFKAQQLMSGIGYQWVRGKMKYGAQLGAGYSFNSVTLDPGVASGRGDRLRRARTRRRGGQQLMGAQAAGEGRVLRASKAEPADAIELHVYGS